MGSFNATCGISGIEIGYEDKLRLVFIAEKTGGLLRGCNCYPTDLWYPISFAIPAVYDDYGTCKINEKSLEWAGFRYFVAREIHTKSENERMTAENEANPKTHSYFDFFRAASTLTQEQVDAITPEKVFNMIHEGKLFLSGGGRVDVFPIKQEVWNQWASAPFENYSGEEVTLDTLLEDTLKEVKEYISRHMEAFAKSTKDQPTKDTKGYRKTIRAQALDETAKYNYNMMDHSYPWKMSADKSFKKTARLKTELYMLVIKMDGIAKMFHPQKTSGGVDKALHNFYSICGEIVKKKYNDRQLDMGYEEKMIP
jgi:hypothetical protein